jgi:hypothetical protein
VSKIIRMLVSAEGEYSLTAGTTYQLPDEHADALVDAGIAEVPAKGSYAPDHVVEAIGNVPAVHHQDGYEEFPANADTEHELEDAGKPAAKRRSAKRAPKK